MAMLPFWTIRSILILCIVKNTIASTIYRRSSGHDFCYNDAEGCGPNTEKWDPLCHTGTHQSPIDLPEGLASSGAVPIDIHSYKGDYFRLKNNGHSIQIDFGGEGPSSQTFTFPNPSNVAGEVEELLSYKWAGGHFHWGATDNAEGSEHSIGGKFSSMELHLVHYRDIYETIVDAIDSEDDNALAVLGILINADELSDAEDALTPIVRNLEIMGDPELDDWKTIDEPLSLSLLLESGGSYVYTYKGSLTTPGCNEQVNWFVLKEQATVTHEDLASIRAAVMDFHGRNLIENHRPLQEINDREIYLAQIME